MLIIISQILTWVSSINWKKWLMNPFIWIIGVGIGSYALGHHNAANEYQAKIESMVNESRLKTKMVEEKIKDLEQQLTKANQANYNEYLRGKEDAKVLSNSIIQSHVTGTKRLYIEVESRSTPAKSTRDTKGTPRTVKRTQLSERSVRFLVTQAERADNDRRELNLCKKTLWEYTDAIQQYNQKLREVYKK